MEKIIEIYYFYKNKKAGIFQDMLQMTKCDAKPPKTLQNLLNLFVI